MADDVVINAFCLLKSQQQAAELLRQGIFDNADAGPCRLIEISRVPAPWEAESE